MSGAEGFCGSCSQVHACLGAPHGDLDLPHFHLKCPWGFQVPMAQQAAVKYPLIAPFPYHTLVTSLHLPPPTTSKAAKIF